MHMTFQLYIVIFTMDSWSVIFPKSSDLNLAAMTDGDNSSCVTFGVDEHILLKGTPVLSFNGRLHITMVMGNINVPDSKVHGANMGPTWVLSAPDGPHVGPMNLAIRGFVWSTRYVRDQPASDVDTTQSINRTCL